MNIGLIVMIIMAIAGFALLFAAAQWRSGYIDDLNKKLSALLNNPVINPNYQFSSLISGTYKGHSVTFEWSPQQSIYGWNSILLYVKIYDLDIPVLETNYRSEVKDNQSDTAKLWQELSGLRRVQEINFSDHILRIEMQWVASLVDEKSGVLLARTPADAMQNRDADHITQEVGTVLDKILKILELLA